MAAGGPNIAPTEIYHNPGRIESGNWHWKWWGMPFSLDRSRLPRQNGIASPDPPRESPRSLKKSRNLSIIWRDPTMGAPGEFGCEHTEDVPISMLKTWCNAMQNNAVHFIVPDIHYWQLINRHSKYTSLLHFLEYQTKLFLSYVNGIVFHHLSRWQRQNAYLWAYD